MGKPSNISAWTRKATHIAGLDRIDGTHHYNRNRFARFLSGPDHYIIRRYNHINFLLNKLAHKPRHPIQSTFRITVLNHDVFILHITEIAQPLPERVEQGRGASRRPVEDMNPIRGRDFAVC